MYGLYSILFLEKAYEVELTPTKGNVGAEEPADATDRWYAGDDKTPTGTQS